MKIFKTLSRRKVKPSYWSLIKKLFVSHRRPLETSEAVNGSSHQIAYREEKQQEKEDEDDEEEDDEEEEGSGHSPNDSQCNT